MSKNINRGERMVRILLFLFQHPVRRYTTTEIMDVLGLAETERRNVQRDLQSLTDIGPESPVACEGAFPHLVYGCGWKGAERVVFPEFDDSLLNFLFLRRIAGLYPATRETIDELVQRIEEELPAQDQTFLKKYGKNLDNRILFMGTPARYDEGSAKHLGTVLRAIESHHKINTDYLKNTESELIRNRVRVPVLIAVYQGEIYVGCRSESNPDKSYFLKLSRLKRVRMLSEMYKDDPAFVQHFRDRVAQSGGMFGEESPSAQKIRLRFSYWCKNTLEENPYHRSLKILRAHDGKIDVSLYVEVNRSLVQWILGFYDRVEVLEPECLRTELKNFSGWLADTYKM